MSGKLQKLFFMFQKLKRDLERWREPGYAIEGDFHSAELGVYYFNFEEERVRNGKDQALIVDFDKNGIPLNRTYVDVGGDGLVYFPISIGQLGLAVFHTYLTTKSEEDRAQFLHFADWFVEHADVSDRLGARWLTHVPLPAYRNPGPWQSAFSQGRGISILLRAYQLTNEMKYAELANQALKSFEIPVSDGGVTSFTEWGPFYEEYTSEVPTLVLNGKIFALCGLYDFVRVFPNDDEARSLFDAGIGTLEKILPKYDLGYWSRYNLCGADWYPEVDPATIHYQKLHRIQLDMLNKIEQNDVFQRYSQRFGQQLDLRNVLKMYRVKYRALKKIGRL